MNVREAKAKLNSISKSTATKHPKVLITELCSVIKMLLDEADRVSANESPTVSCRPQSSQPTPCQPPWPNRPPPSQRRYGDEGDAE